MISRLRIALTEVQAGNNSKTKEWNQAITLYFEMFKENN